MYLCQECIKKKGEEKGLDFRYITGVILNTPVEEMKTICDGCDTSHYCHDVPEDTFDGHAEHRFDFCDCNVAMFPEKGVILVTKNGKELIRIENAEPGLFQHPSILMHLTS